MVKFCSFPLYNIACVVFSVFLLPIHDYTEAGNNEIRTNYTEDREERDSSSSSSAEDKYKKNSALLSAFSEEDNSNQASEIRLQRDHSNDFVKFGKIIRDSDGNDQLSNESKTVSTNGTTKVLTLMNFNGPIITEDDESLQDNKEAAANLNHVRVKRGSANFNDDDDESDKRRNELADSYPNSIGDNAGVNLIRKKRINYEMLLPKSEGKFNAPKIRDYPSNESPIFFNSFSSYENPVELSAASLTRSESKSQVEDTETDDRDFSDSLNGSAGSLAEKQSLQNQERITGRKRKRRFGGNKMRIERRERKSEKKGHGKSHKPKHHKKHKKKEKEGESRDKKRGNEGNETISGDSGVSEFGKATSNEVSNSVLKLQNENAGVAIKSEVDLNEREVPLSRDKRTVMNNGKCGENRESKRRKRRHDFHVKRNPANETGVERAAASVKQIKKIVEKLFDKVDELETYVSNGDDAEDAVDADDKNSKNNKGKDKSEEEDSSSNGTRKEVADSSSVTKNMTKELESKVNCADGDSIKLNVNEEKLKSRDNKLISRRETGRRDKGLIKKRKSHRKWDRWTDWSSCSVTCGKGRQIRWRHCIHDCTSAETEMEEKSCQLPACGPGKFLGIF